jgi:hypothetical protein
MLDKKIDAFGKSVADQLQRINTLAHETIRAPTHQRLSTRVVSNLTLLGRF